MYNVVFFILLLFSFVEIFSKTNLKKHAKLIFFFLLLMIVLRYGQGSDYFNYIYLINWLADRMEEKNYLLAFTQEPGFSLLSYLWIKPLKLSAELLIAFISGLSFFLMWLFIKKYSLKPITSLLIFYTTFYLVYPYSGIRQAICISIFVLYLVPLLQTKKYIKYFIFSILLILFHTSSVILIIIPIVNLLKRYTILQIYFVSIISLGLGILFYSVLFSMLGSVGFIGEKIDDYRTSSSFDFMALLLRILIFIPIMLTFKVYQRGSLKDTFLKIYILGFLLYLMFFSNSLISSRLNVYMRYFEAILIVDYLVYELNNKREALLHYFYIISILSVLYVKNINSFILQGDYDKNITFWNYPYISVFDKSKATILRTVPDHYMSYIK